MHHDSHCSYWHREGEGVRSPTILIVDDDTRIRTQLRGALLKDGYTIDTVSNGRAALGLVTRLLPDLVISDLDAPEIDGLALIRESRSLGHEMPIILVTACGSLRTAVDGIRAGAFDYISKPFILDDVRRVVRRALQHIKLSRTRQQPEDQVRNPRGSENLVGSSPAVVAVYKSIARVAQTESTVLLEGESGTGKELIARAIHANSARGPGPFVAIDGGALTETLLESELFGHERGAFTGALNVKKGLLEKAHAGTCFLDEVADLSPALQGKLLRVIQEREFRRVGGTTSLTVDVRIVAASKRNLNSLVQAGSFREDLYYRLNVVSIRVPPLRERVEDIPPLAKYFVEQYGRSKPKMVIGISPEALSLLTRYWWPGNVRELEHAIEQAVALTPHSIISPEDLPQAIRAKPEHSLPPMQGWMTLAELERGHILRVLKHYHQDLGRSAAILGIHRKTLLRKLRQFGLVDEPRTIYVSPDVLETSAHWESSSTLVNPQMSITGSPIT